MTDLDVPPTSDPAGLTSDPAGLRAIQRRVKRLIEDRDITYTLTGDVGGARAVPWELDVVPHVVETAAWDTLEQGFLQRSRLLDALLTDIYGDRTTLRRGLVPPQLIFADPAYVRADHGTTLPGRHQLFLHAMDVVTDRDGSFRVFADRTGAPSGIGYAIADRQVISRAMPHTYQTFAPRQVSTFVDTLRVAALEAAPAEVDDPEVVVLSPGVHSETAFDQAYLASMLGFPLVEAADLVVRDGALWMRALGELRRVDVVLRRLDSAWVDPLDLRSGSLLGVVGLVEVMRRGAVSIVNRLGSGVLENPGLLPFLPELSRALLDEELLLESVPSWWAGSRDGLARIDHGLDGLLLRRTDREEWTSGEDLDRDGRAELVARIHTEPDSWVAVERPDLIVERTTLPGGSGEREVAPVLMRLFSVAQSTGYVPMAGGMGQVLVTEPRFDPRMTRGAKDIWVRPAERSTVVVDSRGSRSLIRTRSAVRGRGIDVTSPRVLADMYWMGRYAERAEWSSRVLATAHIRAEEARARPTDPGAGSVPVLLAAVAAATGVDDGPTADDRYELIRRHLHRLTVDERRDGTIAQSIAGLLIAARSVRDQLSADTWLIVGRVEQTLAGLRTAPDDGELLAEGHEDIVAAMLSLAGLAAESMIRDSGWQMMRIGRRIERALDLTELMRATITAELPTAVEVAVLDSLLTIGESRVTYRRRYHSAPSVLPLLELLVLDSGNPRSVAYQINDLREGLAALPNDASQRPIQAVDALAVALRRVDPPDLVDRNDDGSRPELIALLDTLTEGILEVADLVSRTHLRMPAGTRALHVGTIRVRGAQ